MNSILEGFILSLISSIQFLILSMHVSIDVTVLNSSSLCEALKDFLTLWSSAKPLNCKSGGMTSCRGEQYRLKILAPAQLPCGTLTDKSFSELFFPFMVTLNDLGLRYWSNHCIALFSRLNLYLSIARRVGWSTVSKAAERSSATRQVTCCFSIDHRMSLLSFKTAVSQE